MSVGTLSPVTQIYESTYAHLQNKMIERIIDALHVATFLRAGGISVLLVYSLIFAGRATGRGIFTASIICNY